MTTNSTTAETGRFLDLRLLSQLEPPIDRMLF